MHRVVRALMCVAGLPLAILLMALPSWADEDRRAGMKKAFLEQAAQGQHAEIALGQLAMQKASSEQVKQFGRRMIAEHLKANANFDNWREKKAFRSQ